MKNSTKSTSLFFKVFLVVFVAGLFGINSIQAQSNQLQPIVKCIYKNVDGLDDTYHAVFGYYNPTNGTIDHTSALESEFYFSNSNSFMNYSDPDSFVPGWKIYSDLNLSTLLKFSPGDHIVYYLNGDSAIADTNVQLCKADIQIEKRMLDPFKERGDTVRFRVIVRNTSYYVPQGTIIVDERVRDSLVYLGSYSSDKGVYDYADHCFHVDKLLPGDSAYLEFAVQANGESYNCGRFVEAIQPDDNPNNNQVCITVCPCSTSGGNDGGLESNGDLAKSISERNFARTIFDQSINFNDKNQMQLFTHENVDLGIVHIASNKRNTSDLAKLIPQNGPFGSKAYVSTPADLLNITNANEIISVDYFDADNDRTAAILAITTDGNEVYEHSKLVCDRLIESSLEETRLWEINKSNFIMTKLVNVNREIDYAISFVAYEKDGKMIVENRWNNEDYNLKANDDVMNFQVWSTSPNSTADLVQKILTHIENKKGALNYISPAIDNIPLVYVKSGYYKNGVLNLNIVNKAEASSITLRGTASLVEEGDRNQLSFNAKLKPELEEQLVAVEIGHLFDFGFVLENEKHQATDFLYLADGPWGVYNEGKHAAFVTSTTFLEQPGYTTNANEYRLERGIEVTGSVNQYLSVFKTLKVNYTGEDLTNFDVIKFNASGPATVELIIASKGVDEWKDQYRKTLVLDKNFREREHKLSTFETKDGKNGFVPDKVYSVIFNVMGDWESYDNFKLKVSDVRFGIQNSSSGLEEFENGNISLYPNPTKGQLNCKVNLTESSQVTIELLDIQGKVIKTLANQDMPAGNNSFEFDLDVDAGFYFGKVMVNDKPLTYQRIVVID